MRTEELSNGRATTGQFLISTRSLAHPVTAVHAQTLLTLTYDGAVLPREYGFPMKLRMPTKLGYKNPKHIQAIFVTNTYPGDYWEDLGYNWFGGS